MNMRESWLRCRVLGVCCCGSFSSVSDEENGLDVSRLEKEVSSGSKIWRFCLDDCAEPYVGCVKDDMFGYGLLEDIGAGVMHISATVL